MPDRSPRNLLTPSLRLRLTLWVVMIFAVIQLTLGLVFLLYQRAAISGVFNQRLQAHADLIRADVAASLDQMSDMQVRAIMRRRMGTVLNEDIVVCVFTQGGAVLGSSHGRPLAPPPGSIAQAIAGGQPRSLRFEIKPLTPQRPANRRPEFVRALLIPIESHQGVPHVLLCATDDQYASRMLGLTTQVFLVTLPIGLLSALVSGWFIAGIATAPLHDLGLMAKGLSPESIGKRLGGDATSTEVAELQNELEKARQRIERGFLAQERFMSNVSHELKTPIAIILTELQTLQTNHADTEVKEFKRSVEQEMRKLGRLVDSFLLLTRVREGKSNTRLERYPVNDLVLDAVARCATMAEQHRVVLDPVILAEDHTLDTIVLGEPELLRTMLDNLVRNAIRFSPERAPVHIEPRVERDRVSITIRDHGSGIPCELLDHVFDRFSQAKSEERRGRGHGLGLEIAQGIAELHGGVITVRNLDEGGCAFTVLLPAAGTDPGTPIDPSKERTPNGDRPFTGR